MTMHRPKELDLAMQSSYSDDQWNVTLQAWVRTKGGAAVLIKALEIARDLLPDELPKEALAYGVSANPKDQQ